MPKKSTDRHLVSTSALAKQLELPAKRVFELLLEKNWIERVNDTWRLTGKGQFEGGDYVNSKKYGEFIGWPEIVLEHSIFAELFNRPLRTRIIGQELGISAHRFNALLAELGWQKSFHRGWKLTPRGTLLRGEEQEDQETGVPYTLWPRAILDDDELKKTIATISLAKPSELPAPLLDQEDAQPIEPASGVTPAVASNSAEEKNQQQLDFADINAAVSEHSELTTVEGSQELFTTLDGHKVEYREDLALDNWLYLLGVNHAYHRSLPTDSNGGTLGYADFYLPAAHLYIECWHHKDNGPALKDKMARLEYYQENDLAHLEIKSNEIDQFDILLPKMLLKHGITVF